jgi:hypothetical protein
MASASFATPGGGARAHYRALEGPPALATVDYLADLADLAAIDAGEVLAAASAGVARYLCVESQDSGSYAGVHRVLMIVAFQVPATRVAEVERWYREEHGPMLLRAPGWLRMRRYRLQAGMGGKLWTHLALHELRDAAVLDSAERALARSTPWRAQLEREGWFAQAGRFVYEYMP